MMPKQEDTARRPLISNTSTLMLSVFLIAAALIELAADDVGIDVLACGLTGLLAYLGLETASERRARKAIADREEDAFRRLNRHLATPVAPVRLDLDPDPLAELFNSTQGPDPGAPGRPHAG